MEHLELSDSVGPDLPTTLFQAVPPGTYRVTVTVTSPRGSVSASVHVPSGMNPNPSVWADGTGKPLTACTESSASSPPS